MISKITIRRFKRFEEISFDLTSPLVLIGPNNAGKTSLLQAITLLEIGLSKWLAQNASNGTKKKRTGVVINRKDLTSIPVPNAKLLWREMRVRKQGRSGSKQKTSNINIEIAAEGWINDEPWHCALEFDYANHETFYCRPLMLENGEGKSLPDLSGQLDQLRVAYLQPMSGLSMQEDLLNEGSVNRLIGEGKTADVIRNICYQLTNPVRRLDTDAQLAAQKEQKLKERWQHLQKILSDRFGASIQVPTYDPVTGLLEMKYLAKGIEYDISSSGRGMQQTLLLLAFIFANAGKVILMDEPDAHLEVIRQRENYNLIRETAQQVDAQLIIASHSEVVLNEAAQKDSLVAVLEDQAIPLSEPSQRVQFRKALTDIGWEKYYLARQKGHCVYLEGSTDQDNLLAFAKLIGHPVKDYLSSANVDFTESNVPSEAFRRFEGLKIAIPDLKGVAIFDQLGKPAKSSESLQVLQWRKRELENYFCTPEVLSRWARSKMANTEGQPSLFRQDWESVMQQCIADRTAPASLRNMTDAYWNQEKLSDWAEAIFRDFYQKVEQPMDMRKGRFSELIGFLRSNEVDPEIREKLDALEAVIRPS